MLPAGSTAIALTVWLLVTAMCAVAERLVFVGSLPSLVKRTTAVGSALTSEIDCALSKVPAPGADAGAAGAAVSLMMVSSLPVIVPPGTVYVPRTVSGPSASGASWAAGTAALHAPPAAGTAGTSTVDVPSVIARATCVASGCAAPLMTTSGAPAASSVAFSVPGETTALRAPCGQPPKPGPPTSPASKMVRPLRSPPAVVRIQDMIRVWPSAAVCAAGPRLV